MCVYAHEYTCLERPKVLEPPTPIQFNPGIIGARELPGMGARKLEGFFFPPLEGKKKKLEKPWTWYTRSL